MLTEEPTLTVDGPDRRVVQEVTQGRYAGIRRIIGRTSDLQKGTVVSPIMGTVLPTNVDRAQMIDHWGPMTLVAVNPRHITYRETKEARHVETVD